ncbi:MAG: hypothetical protein SPL82_16120 [Lachnospiraceae bacterium]|nr:hypothetical protein [Lachnospiraceae bacterium]
MARGYLYVVNTNENESMRVSEEELYNLTGHQFDYIENLPDEKSETLVKDLVQRFAVYGATTGTEELDEGKISYAFLTQEIARKYFAPRLQILKDMIPDMTVDDLIDNGYKIKQLVEDPYGDAVYWNGSFYTLDYFMRNVGNAKVYFGNVLYMN